MGREWPGQRRAGRGLGLVSLSRRYRSARRDQYSLAVVWAGQSTALRRRALPVHDDPHQDAENTLFVDHASAAFVHVRGDIFSWLSEDLFPGPEAWLLERRAIARERRDSDDRS